MVSIREITGAVILIAASSGALAATATITTSVDRIVLHDTDFGGCMVKVSANITGPLPACSGGWVTLDCLAAFPDSTRSMAQNKLTTAQLAFATGKNVILYVTDKRKANGFCYATRVDIGR